MIETLLAHSSDANIVLAMFTCFALAGMAVSAVSFRLFGRRLAVDYTDLVDSVEKSIFAFIVFLLALTLADVRSNFGKAGDSVIAEAFAIRQFSADLELEPGPRATLEQAVLIAYAQAVIDDEWLTLGAPVPALSPVAGARLDELRALIRADAAAIGRTLQIDRVWLAVGQLENNRQLRLQQCVDRPLAIAKLAVIVVLDDPGSVLPCPSQQRLAPADGQHATQRKLVRRRHIGEAYPVVPRQTCGIEAVRVHRHGEQRGPRGLETAPRHEVAGILEREGVPRIQQHPVAHKEGQIPALPIVPVLTDSA